MLTCIPDDAAQKNLLAEFKRTLRPGGLLLISDYPLQTDARNLERYAKFAGEPGGYGSFRLPEGTVLRHHSREWFTELLADFAIDEFVELDAMNDEWQPGADRATVAANPSEEIRLKGEFDEERSSRAVGSRVRRYSAGGTGAGRTRGRRLA